MINKVFIINLPQRKDRLDNILKEFEKKKEFIPKIINPVSHSKGEISLFETVLDIIKKNYDKPYIIICEDDHVFTDNYNSEVLKESINWCIANNVDVLTLGSFSIFGERKATNNLALVDAFLGTQFIVIFKNGYDEILKHKKAKTHIDMYLSKVCKKKAIAMPIMSRQKFFGYSDIGVINKNGHQKILFDIVEERLNNLKNQ